MPFDELIPALEGGKIDMIIACMTITPPRNMRVAYVGPYFMSGQSLITTKEIATGIKTADDINKPDFSVGVTGGTTSEISARGMMPKARIVVKKTLAEVLDLMLQGKVMGVITDYPTASVVALQYQDKGIIGLKPFTVEPVGIAVRPDDFLFVNLMQNFLNTLQINGQLQAMTNRWFENPWWLNQLPAMHQFL